MHDDLMEKDPEMIKLREKWRAEGFAEGLAQRKTEGKREAIREVILIIVKVNFPSLIETAQQKVARMRSIKNLWYLFKQLLSAPDEATARALLTL